MKEYCIIIDNDTGKAARSKTKTAIYANTTITAKEFNFMKESESNIETIRNYTIYFEFIDWKSDTGYNLKYKTK